MAHIIRFDKNTSLELMLAYYAAPTMFGIKPASLFWCCADRMHEQIALFNEYAKAKGLIIKCIHKGEKHTGLFVYNHPLLKRCLNDVQQLAILQRFGYKRTLTPEEKLEKLCERMKTCLPHEIGLFLGYPISDVKGYIENKGQNYILRGNWLVYSNPEHAQRLFIKYKWCRDWLVGSLLNGMSLYDFLNQDDPRYKR